MQIDLFISVISTLRDGSMLEERRMLIDSGTPVTGASVPEDAVAQITLVSPDLPLSAGPHVQIDDLGCWLTPEQNGCWTGVLSGGDPRRPFLNHAGTCEAVLSWRSAYSDMEGADEGLRDSMSVQLEILATKKNAKAARDMLAIISESYSDPELWEKKHEGNDLSGTDERIVIKRAAEIISSFEDRWPYILRSMRVTLESTIEYDEHGIANSPEALSWLSRHPDQLYVTSHERADFTVYGIPVRVGLGAVEKVVPRRNLYENEVIYGALHHMVSKLGSIRRSMAGRVSGPVKGRITSQGGYARMSDIISEYRRVSMGGTVAKVLDLERRGLRLLRSFSDASGISGSAAPLEPIVTPYVAKNLVYYQIFSSIMEWYRISNGSIETRAGVYTIVRLDRLYEYCLLVKIVHALSGAGLKRLTREYRDYAATGVFGGRAAERPKDRPFNYYAFTRGSCRVELFYEALVKRWQKAQSGDPIIVVPNRHSDGRNDCWCPDFIIRISGKKGQSSFIILDAKYTTPQNVLNTSLPELVRKYVLGIHVRSDGGKIGTSPVQAVWALYPDGSSESVNYYFPEHGFGGAHEILPSIGGLRVHPGDPDNVLSKFLGTLIGRIADGLEKGSQKK
ncbi:MAG: hypothetical protein SPL41_02225 [Succinivibrionaceae bacterium]|nr:hypothetical protein [Succinivibrionaceae bacterium]